MQKNQPLVSKGFIVALIFGLISITLIYIIINKNVNDQVNNINSSSTFKSRQANPTPVQLKIQVNSSSNAAATVPSK